MYCCVIMAKKLIVMANVSNWMISLYNLNFIHNLSYSITKFLTNEPLPLHYKKILMDNPIGFVISSISNLHVKLAFCYPI